MALRKPYHSLRPVAEGETLRCLCGKVVVELVGFSVRSILRWASEPAMAARRWSTPRATGFQPIEATRLRSRQRFQVRCQACCVVGRQDPLLALAPWTDTCYRYQSNLFAGDTRIGSTRGGSAGKTLWVRPSLHWRCTPTFLKRPEPLTLLPPAAQTSRLFSWTTHHRWTSTRGQALFLSTLESALHEVGRAVARDKTEVSPCSFSMQNFTSLTLCWVRMDIRWMGRPRDCWYLRRRPGYPSPCCSGFCRKQRNLVSFPQEPPSPLDRDRRRPADVCFPRRPIGNAKAWDVSLSSGFTGGLRFRRSRASQEPLPEHRRPLFRSWVPVSSAGLGVCREWLVWRLALGDFLGLQ